MYFYSIMHCKVQWTEIVRAKPKHKTFLQKSITHILRLKYVLYIVLSYRKSFHFIISKYLLIYQLLMRVTWHHPFGRVIWTLLFVLVTAKRLREYELTELHSGH